MHNRSGIEQFLKAKLPAGLDLLREMVEINSYTANPAGVNRLARLTADRFAPLGFSADFVASKNPAFGNHLVLTKRGKSSKNVAMISHLDTVFPPEEEERNNFRWQPDGDRIFGPGTEDIKGGTVMIWLVLSAIQSQAPELYDQLGWTLLLNSSEEQFSPDFGHLCRTHFNAATIAALIFEAEGRLGNERLLVVARKGRASWRVTSSGRGAHAGGKHEHGANAIVQLGETVQKIAALTDYSRQLTCNVGTITGGTVLNRVPHEAVAEGEFRAFTPEVYQCARQTILSLSGPGSIRSPADKFACQIKAEILTETGPWPRNAATDRLYSIWKEAADELAIPVGPQERGGLSDGNLIWDAVPTIDGLGPWGDNDHCSERSPDGSKLPEYVEISSFVPKALL
ncbi:MAG TPA: M20/M25/M40 family metallo-hydrolase, partial [Candidatus Dormibacteraeota bacterium]|nr:M20/M25/M40 family metallo-hydrolase [Candidatus Dormibacteraeota bacterium]